MAVENAQWIFCIFSRGTGLFVEGVGTRAELAECAGLCPPPMTIVRSVSEVSDI